MEYLQYGDFIILQGTSSNNFLTGVLSSVGCINQDVYLETIPQLQDEGTSNNLSNITRTKNSRDYIYQIWPKLNIDQHKQFTKIQKEIQQLEQYVAQIEETSEL